MSLERTPPEHREPQGSRRLSTSAVDLPSLVSALTHPVLEDAEDLLLEVFLAAVQHDNLATLAPVSPTSMATARGTQQLSIPTDTPPLAADRA